MSRFKLLRGIHQQTEVCKEGGECLECANGKRSDGKRCVRCKGTGKKHTDVTYKAGSILESTLDLEVKFGADRFQNLDRITSEDSSGMKKKIDELEALVAELRAGKASSQSAVPEKTEDSVDNVLPEGIETWEADALKTFAKEMGIDLGGANKKADMLKVIKKAVGEMAPASA